MWRHIAANALTLLIVLVVVLGALVAWGQHQFTGPGPLTEPIFFEVESGDSLAKVSEALGAEGAISSPTIFRLGTRYAEQARNIKFGIYELPAGASMETILAILTTGGQSSYRYVVNYVIGVGSVKQRLTERTAGTGEVEELAEFAPGDELPEPYATLVAEETPMAYRVTVTPGTTVWQVAEALKAADFLSGELATLPSEGMLATETYEVRRDGLRGELLADMAAAQAAVLAAAWEARSADLPVTTPEEALVLASIIEKETGVPDERRQVASVFVNRLKRGMRLQTDPTVIYGITEGKRVLGRGLRQSELRKETPYNTYVIEGLPPTPIANPSRAAIEAALDPAATDYLYFVADGTGGHAFAETLEEHNRNVARWREIEAERKE